MPIKATSHSLNYFASYCCVKHYDQKQLGGGMISFHLAAHSPLWMKRRQKLKQARDQEAGIEAETMEEGCLWSCSSQCAQLSIFFYYSDLSFKHIDVIFYLSIFYLSAKHVHAMSKVATRGLQIPWNWNNKCSRDTMWILEVETRSSRRAASINHWAISPSPQIALFIEARPTNHSGWAFPHINH